MKVLLIHRNVFQNRPPLVSLVKTMVGIGIIPTVITTGLNDEYKQYFEDHNIKYYTIPFSLTRTRFSRLKNYVKGKTWGRRVNKLISTFSREETLLWIEANYTFSALDAHLINSYKHVLQIQEMFNDSGLKGVLYKGVIKKLSKGALAIFVPEYNRAFFYKLDFGLKKLPYILPNKPAFVPNEEDLVHLHEKYKKYDMILNKKVILYQGIISSTRSNYEPVLNALNDLDEKKEFVFVFLGREDTPGYVERLKRQGYNVEHIPFIPAPEYLYFTSRAYIGIVNYADNCLNNIYCAPNKIYEYAAFGVPMLANDIPGLRYTVGINNCACLYSDENVIEDALNNIIQNHDTMSENAKEFFKLTDYEKTLRIALHDLNLL